VLLVLPAILALLIVLIPTLKFQWPLSWDIYYHVHLARLYLEHGLTWWDPLTVAPSGRPIAYPPVFHLLIAGFSYILSADPFQVVRFMQPVLAFSLVFSITYVAYRLFGLLSGLAAGLLTILSFITINRGFFASPGTLSLIIMPLVLYTFYQANEEGKLRFILISGLLSGLIFLTHSFTALIIIMVVLIYTASMFLLKRPFNRKFLVIFLLISGLIALIWWGPLYILYNPHFNVFAGYPLPISEYYVRYLGIIPTLLATIGGLCLLKKGENKGIFILIWALSTLLLSRAYLIGLDVIPIRVLEIASYPLIIMAGYGLAVSLNMIEERLRTNRRTGNILIRKFKFTIIIILTLFTLISGVVFADGYTSNLISSNDSHSDYIFPNSIHLLFNPLDYVFKFQVIADRYGNLILAKNRMGVANWFMENGDRNKTVYSTDSYLDTIIVSTSRLHVIKGGYSESIPSNVFKRDMNDIGSLTRDQLLKENIKYLILRNGVEIPSYAREVYRNGNYIICIIE
jgi:4-amino-4-deoxy-L-arabinose transferase-like glycosyltransferase